MNRSSLHFSVLRSWFKIFSSNFCNFFSIYFHIHFNFAKLYIVTDCYLQNRQEKKVFIWKFFFQKMFIALGTLMWNERRNINYPNVCEDTVIHISFLQSFEYTCHGKWTSSILIPWRTIYKIIDKLDLQKTKSRLDKRINNKKPYLFDSVDTSRTTRKIVVKVNDRSKKLSTFIIINFVSRKLRRVRNALDEIPVCNSQLERSVYRNVNVLTLSPSYDLNIQIRLWYVCFPTDPITIGMKSNQVGRPECHKIIL